MTKSLRLLGAAPLSPLVTPEVGIDLSPFIGLERLFRAYRSLPIVLGIGQRQQRGAVEDLVRHLPQHHGVHPGDGNLHVTGF